MVDWQEAVDMKPGSYVNMPVCAYSLRMSITSGPMVPWYTGISTLGLPLLKDSVALLSASFIVVPKQWSMPRSPRCARVAQHLEHFLYVRPVQRALRLRAPQQQVKQVVVRQVHQLPECIGLAHRQAGCVAVEKALDEQVVLQQPAAAAPAQLAEGPLVEQRFSHCGSNAQTARLTINSL